MWHDIQQGDGEGGVGPGEATYSCGFLFGKYSRMASSFFLTIDSLMILPKTRFIMSQLLSSVENSSFIYCKIGQRGHAQQMDRKYSNLAF